MSTDPLPQLVDEYLKKKFKRVLSKRLKPRKRKKGKIVPKKNATAWGWIVGEREICDTKTDSGRAEYLRRVHLMEVRQGGRCGCGAWFVQKPATFGHDIPRGNGGMNRDDRIYDAEGKPMNHAECLQCNNSKGSKRLSKGE